MSELPTEDRGPRFHIPIYDDVLKHAETFILVVLLFGVIFSTFLNIIDRNFQIGIWDYAVVEKMIYSAVFYIGMFGGVAASRRAKHISIDAVAHLMPERPKLILGAILQVIGGITCVLLTRACYVWLYTVIDADEALLPAMEEWYLNMRLWRWPVVIAFAWMALHFFVNAFRYGYDAIYPRPIVSIDSPGSEPVA